MSSSHCRLVLLGICMTLSCELATTWTKNQKIKIKKDVPHFCLIMENVTLTQGL